MVCFRRLVLGGTFETLHKGHKELLSLAFSLSEKVTIGLSTDDFAAERGKKASPYDKRAKRLQELLVTWGFSNRFEIVPISDPIGPALGEFDAILVSQETETGADLVNSARISAGKKPLVKVVMPMVVAEDKIPISSSRIQAGEIDEEGNKI